MKTKKGDKAVLELGITTVVGFLFYFAAVLTKSWSVATFGLAAVSCVSLMYFSKTIWEK